MKIKKVKIGGGYHCLIDCKIDGKKAIGLIDTGASATVFPENSFLEILHPTINRAKTLTIGGTSYEFDRPNYFNWSNIKSAYAKARKKIPSVLIGMDILNGAIIDLKNNSIVLK